MLRGATECASLPRSVALEGGKHGGLLTLASGTAGWKCVAGKGCARAHGSPLRSMSADLAHMCGGLSYPQPPQALWLDIVFQPIGSGPKMGEDDGNPRNPSSRRHAVGSPLIKGEDLCFVIAFFPFAAHVQSQRKGKCGEGRPCACLPLPPTGFLFC